MRERERIEPREGLIYIYIINEKREKRVGKMESKNLPKHSCLSLVSAYPSEQMQPPFEHSLLGIVQSLSSVHRSPSKAVTTRIVAGVGLYAAATPGK